MKPRPLSTIKDVARRAGVSTATVSRVSRGFAGVNTKTRAKVEAAIAELGYRPDLAAASLRQSGPKPPSTSTINVAVLTDLLQYEPNKTEPVQALIEAGGERGFSVEHFDITHDGPLNPLLRMLRHRGFRAIILASLSRGGSALGQADFSPFVVVNLDRRASGRPYFSVRTDVADLLEGAWDHVRARGYRRIGLALHRYFKFHPDDRTFENVGRGLESALTHEERLEPFILSGHLVGSVPLQFKKWLQRTQPDAVIGYGPSHLRWIHECGLRVPEDVGFAALSQHSLSPPTITGWWEDPSETAELTLDWVDLLLRRGMRGELQQPPSLLLRPTWVEGFHLPKKQPD